MATEPGGGAQTGGGAENVVGGNAAAGCSTIDTDQCSTRSSGGGGGGGDDDVPNNAATTDATDDRTSGGAKIVVNKPSRKKAWRPQERNRCTCAKFWKENARQNKKTYKTSSAVIVALLWSTALSSLFDAVFASSFEDFKEYQLWTSFALTSVLVCTVVPVIAVRYLRPADLWAITILIEILGHLWGFKLKDLIVHYAYHFHYLYAAYEAHSLDNLANHTEFSYCNFVNPEYVVVTNDGPIDASSLGWAGFNLDWTWYVRACVRTYVRTYVMYVYTVRWFGRSCVQDIPS